MWADTILSIEGPNRIKINTWIGRGPIYFLFWSGVFISSCPWTSEFMVVGTLDSHTYIISSPASQAFGFRLNYTTSFPRSLACFWNIAGILGSPQSCQPIPIINALFCISIFSVNSLSLEKLDKYILITKRYFLIFPAFMSTSNC